MCIRDRTVAVDVEHSAIQTMGSPGNHLLERDVAITGNGRRPVSYTHLFSLFAWLIWVIAM